MIKKSWAKTSIIAMIICALLGLSSNAYGDTASFINEMGLKRMNEENEQEAVDYYDVNIIPSNNSEDAMIEAFDLGDNGIIALALDNQTIMLFDQNMKPVKKYAYNYPSGIEALVIVDDTLYIFWVRLTNCIAINLDDNSAMAYEWLNDNCLMNGADKLLNRVYMHQGDNDYFISNKKDKQVSGIKKNYRYLIRVDGKGEKTILYESNNKHDFEFANITQPIILAGILLANILIIGVRRRRKHE